MDILNIEIQKLIDYCHSFAEKILIEESEFYPFGAYLDKKSQLTPVGFKSNDEFPLSNDVINGLKNYFNSELKKEQIKAFAISFDTKVKNEKFPDSIDAISIQIKHTEMKEIINYFFPYKLRRDNIDFFESWQEYI